MGDKHTPWMMHDMEPMTVVTAKKPGKFIALFDGRSFDEETNERHARLALRAVNCHEELVEVAKSAANCFPGHQTADMARAALAKVEASDG